MMNTISTVLFCHEIFSNDYPQKVKDVNQNPQHKMYDNRRINLEKQLLVANFHRQELLEQLDKLKKEEAEIAENRKKKIYESNIDNVFASYDKPKSHPGIPDISHSPEEYQEREKFVKDFASILVCAGITISVGEAERIAKLYHLAKQKGSSATIDEICATVK